MQEAIKNLFARYERETNAALAGKPDLNEIGKLYEDGFIAAAPAGVMLGKNDDEFKKSLAAGFTHYSQIGTKRMTVRKLAVEPIDKMHALARVDWQADYDTNGQQKAIDFTNVYLVRVVKKHATVFGWITGDEQAELRKHGIG